jgi:hypothetical protein
MPKRARKQEETRSLYVLTEWDSDMCVEDESVNVQIFDTLEQAVRSVFCLGKSFKMGEIDSEDALREVMIRARRLRGWGKGPVPDKGKEDDEIHWFHNGFRVTFKTDCVFDQFQVEAFELKKQ